MRAFAALVGRDLRLLFKQGAGVGIAVIFFFSLVLTFPLSIGPDPKVLQKVAPAILWTGPLLSILLGIERIFLPDFEDGSYEIYLMSHLPLSGIILAKIMANWFGLCLPLILISPIFGLILNMSADAIIGCLLSLFIGSPAIIFYGTFCGVITAKLKNASMLLVVLALPFLIPTLIFGVLSSVGYSSPNLPFKAPILILAAITLLSTLISTIGASMALRNLR